MVDSVLEDPESAPVSDKMKALLIIAEQVRRGGKQVTATAVDHARAEGATDLEIHDTVLIAAAFCMYNRYVDGLAAWTPTNPRVYEANAQQVITHGYTALSAG
jgi:alkylhydroperoxidase family enzyme